MEIMCSESTNFLQPIRNRCYTVFPRAILISSIFLSAVSHQGWLYAQAMTKTSFGLAWRVQGSWRLEGESSSVVTGDSIAPGSLLFPVQGAPNHSITILLPDGQRILYECFQAADCSHGFRVPWLYRTPKPIAMEMLARIHTVLLHNQRDLPAVNKAIVPDESLALLGTENRAEISGLVSKLSNGIYTYSLRSTDHSFPDQSNLSVEKSGPDIRIPLPGPGLYDLTLSDELNTPRIDLLIAAVSMAQWRTLSKKYKDARELLADWNIDHQGWPIHEFHRAYLKSLLLDIRPHRETLHRVKASVKVPANTAAEPVFLPRPGSYKRDIEVKIATSTRGATIHYTVDGAQPLASSQIYQAPIMVKQTGLNIKAFASSPGKKDSPVVTGFFKVGELEVEK